MSYATSFFEVDLDGLCRIVAEHDLSILERVQTAEPDQFEHKLQDGDPTLGEALRQIVAGEAPGVLPSHQYGYALKLLCQMEGEWLPDDEDLIADLEPPEVYSPFQQPRLPIDIPASQDFPFVRSLRCGRSMSPGD